MLKAYAASVSFIEEHKAALGPNHRTVANSIRTEILHLTKLFRSEELPTGGGRQSITELIKHIRADGSGTFSSEVKNSLIEAAIARLGGDTADFAFEGIEQFAWVFLNWPIRMTYARVACNKGVFPCARSVPESR